MKRYKVNTTVTREDDHMHMRTKYSAESIVAESLDGPYVLYSDYVAMQKYLESQIPELRIRKLEQALNCVSEGKCPECGEVTRGYQPPIGSFAPEAWATLREQGVDPGTGHKKGCSLNK